jgi:hypothetical protein
LGDFRAENAENGKYPAKTVDFRVFYAKICVTRKAPSGEKWAGPLAKEKRHYVLKEGAYGKAV